MPLVIGLCKTAILQGQILAKHSSVAVGLMSSHFPTPHRSPTLQVNIKNLIDAVQCYQTVRVTDCNGNDSGLQSTEI